jgi:short-subunit dehydrogenase
MKSVVITGSTRGIGLCMAKEFLKVGCNITVSGRGKNISGKLEKELSSFNNNYIYTACDVSRIQDVEKLWDISKKKWGSIDIWINNAGQNCPFEYCYHTHSSYVDSLIDTNIKGVIYGSQVAAANMIKVGCGQIWNMEGLGSNGMIQEKTIIYGMSKQALTYFTKALAKELRNTGVLAGRLSPGMMLTDFITKTPDGDDSPVVKEKSFRFVFNALADRPETVARFFIPRILANKKNNAQISWLTRPKTLWRFATASFKKGKLI